MQPRKGQRAAGARRGLPAEKRLAGGKAQGPWTARVQVLEGAGLLASGTRVELGAAEKLLRAGESLQTDPGTSGARALR